MTKLPAVFRLDQDDFDVYFRQFCNYCESVYAEPATKFGLLLSFLDARAFSEAEKVNFSVAERLAIRSDLKAAFPKLNLTLDKAENKTLPAKITILFRKQKPGEEVLDFASIISGLATSAYGIEGLSRGDVISAFCVGVSNTDLSAKLLLRDDFNRLNDAVDVARTFITKQNVRDFIAEKRNPPRPEFLSVVTPDVKSEEIVGVPKAQREGD